MGSKESSAAQGGRRGCVAGRGVGREEVIKARAEVREVGEGGASMSAGGLVGGFKMEGERRDWGGRTYKGGIQRLLLLLGTLCVWLCRFGAAWVCVFRRSQWD